MLLIRLLDLFMLGFLFFVVRDGTKLSNLRLLFGLFALSYGVTYWSRDGLGEECFDIVFHDWKTDLSFPLLAMICAYVERHVDGGTTAETTPLV